MKKLFTFVLIFVMLFALSAITFATDSTDTSTNVSTEDTAGEIVEETTNKISTILGISGTVGVGAIIVAVIAFFLRNLKKISNVVKTMANAFSSIFSKDGNIENVPQAFNSVKGDINDLAKGFNAELDTIKAKLEESESKNEQLTQILSIYIISSNNINPHYKNELIKLISGTMEFGENIADTIKTIQASVEQAKASEIKPDTPYLDKVTSEE